MWLSVELIMMTRLLSRLQQYTISIRLTYCIPILIINIALLYLYLCFYHPHRQNFIMHYINEPTEDYSALLYSKYRFTFEPTFVSGHVEWHAVFQQPIPDRLRLSQTQWTEFVELVVNQFRLTGDQLTPNISTTQVIEACLDKREDYPDGWLWENCSSVLGRFMSVGRMPPEVLSSPNLSRTYDENNPSNEYSKIYQHPSSLSDIVNHSVMVNLTCGVVSRRRRSSLYRTMQQWIRFADENKIMWWLSSGTLLGAIRDGNIIPYDSDMDISVLGSVEPKLRKLSTERRKIRRGQFNLVLRPAAHCITSNGIRQDCSGRIVSSPTDSCAFCGPVARAFYQPEIYMDVFLVHFEVHLDEEQRPVRFGHFDESCDKFESGFKGLFPLRYCRFLGLSVPCPYDPASLLRIQYGGNFLNPSKSCNLTSGQWVKAD